MELLLRAGRYTRLMIFTVIAGILSVGYLVIAGVIAGTTLPAIVGANAANSALFNVANMTAADVHGSARLTRAERADAERMCVNKVISHGFLRRGNINVQGSVKSMKQKLEHEAAPVCDCIVNQFEDRSSKMQFVMLMDGLNQANAVSRKFTPANVEKYWDVAQKNGMKRGDFEAAGRMIVTIARSSIVTCEKHLTGN